MLEIGGTHITAAVVDPADWAVAAVTRQPLDADAPAGRLFDAFARAAAPLDVPPGTTWGVAMPDPFDYSRGIGLFTGVGKFAALYAVDVRAALEARLAGPAMFLNDADAFALGEWTAGAATGAHRCLGLTLGTGVGSGWLVDGAIADPLEPPGGRAHLLTVAGVPLEDLVSRRAMRRAFAAAGGDPDLDVREIAELARSGAEPAPQVLHAAMTMLGRVLARPVAIFDPDVLVVGGSMSASWDVLGPPFVAGLSEAGAFVLGAPVRTVVAAHPDDAPLIGAAAFVRRARLG